MNDGTLIPTIRVLLVDDDMVDRMACQRSFASDTSCRFELIEADTGQDGLSLAEQERPDCILLDYQLPDLTGLEFLERLNRGSGKSLPVMMLTGADNATVAAESMRRGALDYIVKDNDRRYLQLLPAAIHRMLREQRLIDDKRQADATLLQTRDALRELAAHQENIREDERKRIAREVHDELGGLLSGIRAYISVSVERAIAAGVAPDPLLVDAAALAKDALEAVRRVITDLRPSVLDQLGVWAALEWYAEQIAQRSGMQCTCTIEPDLLAQDMDADRSTMLFRIVQEALTNVVRHANASQVHVRAGWIDGMLQVSVEDDGKGVEASKLFNGESWGVLGMTERARHFGGELRVTGSAGAGTTLHLQFPWEGSNGGQ